MQGAAALALALLSLEHEACEVLLKGGATASLAELLRSADHDAVRPPPGWGGPPPGWGGAGWGGVGWGGIWEVGGRVEGARETGDGRLETGNRVGCGLI